MTLSLLEEPEDEGSAELLPTPANWPAPPDRTVYHELLGEIVDRIAPHTEADPVAILTQLIVGFGAAVGRSAWFSVEATRHHPNEFMLLVGDSSRARKGSSWDHVRRLLATIDPSIEPRVMTGLSTAGRSCPPCGHRHPTKLQVPPVGYLVATARTCSFLHVARE